MSQSIGFYDFGGEVGKRRLQLPDHIAAVQDIVAEVAYKDGAPRLRLWAAAVGLCWTGEAPAPSNGDPKVPSLKLPRYSLETANPVAYGATVMAALYGKGVPPDAIYELGKELAFRLGATLPAADGSGWVSSAEFGRALFTDPVEVVATP